MRMTSKMQKDSNVQNCHCQRRQCLSSSFTCRVIGALTLLLMFTLQFDTALGTQSPPLIIKQPPTDELLFQVVQRIDESDKAFIIECEAEGSSEPKYKWFKDGKEFNWQEYKERMAQPPGQGTLVVTSPKDEDAGHYQCFAYNEHGTATSNSVFVRKAELNTFKEEHTQTLTANEGKPFSLPCNSPDGWPRPAVYWMLQNPSGALKSINSSRITVDPDGTLWFSNITIGDKSEGFNYACTAYSTFRNEYKLGNRAFLNVAPMSGSVRRNKVPPTQQYVTNQNTVATRGQTVQLWCIVGGTPLPDIKWTKSGGSIPMDRAEFDNYGKTIKIVDVDFKDEGSYTCEASNGVGSPLSYSVQLSINSLPYFTVEPEITNAAEGETVEFRCEALGKPTPTIKWIHNGKPVEEAPSNSRRIVESNRIIIKDIVKQDTGNYGCNATNSLGYVYKDVYVNVLALPPEITEPPRDKVTTEGKTVTLTCRVFGAPKPTVKWYRNGELVQRSRRFDVQDNGDLQIQDVTFSDAGSYQCYAENKFGNESRTGSLVVKVSTVIKEKPVDSEVQAGSTATLRCSADADSTLNLQIDWLQDGELIDFDYEQRFVKLQDNSLTIDRTTEVDSAVYTCVARTEVDSVTANVTLTVQDVPNQPILKDVTCEPRVARISWEEPNDNKSPILYYTIQFSTSFTPDLWETDDALKDVPATERSYTVAMSPWANYRFRVIARNKIGPSLASSPSIVCTTPVDVPFKNPENVKGDGTEPNNLRISWTAMPEIEHNAPNFRYEVQWKPDDEVSPWTTKNITDWRTNELIIPNQPTYRPYLVKIRAVNEQGESNMSPVIVRGFSGQNLPSEAPQNLTVSAKFDGLNAHISWDPVSPESLNGKFEGYKVQTWSELDGEENSKEFTTRNDVTSAVVNLVPYSRNFIRVYAYNTAYNGPPSRTIEIMAGEGRPGPVEHLEAYPLGTSSLYLVWQKPERPNGKIVGYRIHYVEVSGTEVRDVDLMEREPNITNAETTQAKLSHLKPRTKYRVFVAAVTGAGIGLDKTFVEVTTYQVNATSLAKPKFRWAQEPTQNGLAAIKIFWLPTIDGGEDRPGSHFYVEYKRYDESEYIRADEVLHEDFDIVRGLEPDNTYVFRVVSVDGDKEKLSDDQEIFLYAEGGVIIEATAGGRTTAWFIALIVALAFLVLLLILVCIVKRNRGGKYAVYEREIAHGRLDYDESGFREYTLPPAGARASDANDFKNPLESDTDSMVEYGDEARFTEDGSFIGQYGAKKKSDASIPSPTATFV